MSGLTRAIGRVRQRASARAVAVAAAGALGLTAGVTGMAHETDGGDHLLLTAEFEDVSPLLSGSEVETHGVGVGKVAGIEVGEDDNARVGVRLDSAALPVHRDARLTVRAVSLLGERYLELDRGDPSEPVLRHGATIPVEQTGQAVDLDEVLNTIDEPTGEGLAALATVLGEGMRGNGADVDETIRVLAEAMDDTGELAGVLAEHNELLSRMIDNVRPVAASLAEDEGKTLDGLLESTLQLTDAASSRQEELQESVSELPATLEQTEASLERLNAAANEATPTLEEVRPVTEDLEVISTEISSFAETAEPALASTEPVLDRAVELLDEAGPVAEELREAGPDLRSVAADAEPVVTGLANNFDDVLDFLRNWALTTNGYDGLSHYFRAHLVLDPTQLAGPDLGLLGGEEEAEGDEAGEQGDALEDAGDLAEEVPGGLLEPSGDGEGDGSATGLSQEQERGVLDFLVGGEQ
ncbi:phospholipid/cholesterol/gamma-HCH transport system substrate-binding protein [Haloechinothrix alba]|uniref:Phospholipid/cholesterol/gamma-HCH transport system substrate-binding protein n=2 Tax=Haloechinothrix alba TaxID=664784 RepID=A0A239A1B5_9PSEU|nr:phospholipid/cholesterol/gamma-HCH transport system substrate-binding protein [Haloechinothrix alba]